MDTLPREYQSGEYRDKNGQRDIGLDLWQSDGDEDAIDTADEVGGDANNGVKAV